MNPTEIKAALATLGGGANKRLGQHFLIDQAALDSIVGAAYAHPGMLTLEVGPGLGVLTSALLAKGCEVTAIERDSRFVDWLGRGAWHAPSDLIDGSDGPGRKPCAPTVIRADAADLDWMTVIGNREWQLISNLPYAISSLALRKALWSTRPAENVVVLVQREVGERAMTNAGGTCNHPPTPPTRSGEGRSVPADPPPYEGGVRGGCTGRLGKTSLLSLMVALASSSVRILRRVPPGAFFPPPKVDSVVLQITPIPWPERMERWGIDPEEIMKVAKLGFAHPRKLLASNLKSILADAVGAQGLRPGPLNLSSIGIPEKARAEDLSPDQWAALTRYLKNVRN